MYKTKLNAQLKVIFALENTMFSTDEVEENRKHQSGQTVQV